MSLEYECNMLNCMLSFFQLENHYTDYALSQWYWRNKIQYTPEVALDFRIVRHFDGDGHKNSVIIY